WNMVRSQKARPFVAVKFIPPGRLQTNKRFARGHRLDDRQWINLAKGRGRKHVSQCQVCRNLLARHGSQEMYSVSDGCELLLKDALCPSLSNENPIRVTAGLNGVAKRFREEG